MKNFRDILTFAELIFENGTTLCIESNGFHIFKFPLSRQHLFQSTLHIYYHHPIFSCEYMVSSFINTQHPKILMSLILGFDPNQASYGVLLERARVGSLLSTYAECLTASPQNSGGTSLAFMKLLVINTIVLFSAPPCHFVEGSKERCSP